MNYAQLLFPDFALIICGYLVCRYTALNRTVWEQVESLVYYFLFPVLLFHSIVKSPLDLGATSSLISAGVLMGLAGIAMAYSLPHLPWLRRHIDVREHAARAVKKAVVGTGAAEKTQVQAMLKILLPGVKVVGADAADALAVAIADAHLGGR